MTAIIHTTPGLIDIRAFTLMGVSAKPNSTNPIGQFGTGLKYAVAVLVRLGCNPVVYIGLDRYEFFCKPSSFRGKEFNLLRIKRQRWSLTRATTHDLPFSTDYGHNWEPWMVFRELESNTCDEGGSTFLHEEGDGWEGPTAATTTILVDLPEYVEAWKDRDSIFLPGGLTEKESSWAVQVLKGTSDHLYYRSVRALDLPKPTLMTYNFQSGQVTISEDRKIAYTWQVRSHLASHLLKSEDEDFIEQVITCEDDYWEYGLDFPSHIQPGQAFQNVVQRNPRNLWGSARDYYVGWSEPKKVRARIPNQIDHHPGPWRIVGDAESNQQYMEDASGTRMLDRPEDYDGDWTSLAEAIRRIVRREERLTPEPDPYVWENEGGALPVEAGAPADSVWDDEDMPF